MRKISIEAIAMIGNSCNELWMGCRNSVYWAYAINQHSTRFSRTDLSNSVVVSPASVLKQFIRRVHELFIASLIITLIVEMVLQKLPENCSWWNRLKSLEMKQIHSIKIKSFIKSFLTRKKVDGKRKFGDLVWVKKWAGNWQLKNLLITYKSLWIF